MRWRKGSILGVGLLGGSLGLALRQRGMASEVVGFVRRQASIAECLRHGAVTHATTDLAEALAEADLVVLCTPVAQMGPLASRFPDLLARHALVTDVGSVKDAVIAAVEPAVRAAGGRFIGSHPMAGAERIGVASARAELFSGAVCVITPTPGSDTSAISEVAALWEGVGARVLRMSAAAHDELVSRASHLPHVVAAALVLYILSSKHPPEQAMLCATGFRDMTRVASGSPEMWRDIALANREALLKALAELDEHFLGGFRHALIHGNDEEVLEFFAAAKRRRDAWCANGTQAVSE